MGGMPETITKGKILARIDEVSQDGARLKEFLNDLRTSNSDLVTILVRQRVVLPKREETHMREYWFGSWWPNTRAERIVREGLVTAFARAFSEGSGGKPLPLDCYWICREDKTVQVSISWNDRQVVLLIFTPMPPEKGVATTEENIEIAKLDPTGSIVVVRGRTGPPPT